MKIAINRCYGGFGLSRAAYAEMGIPWDGHGMDYNDDEKRNDPALIACIEKLGRAASDKFACVRVVEIPDDVEWEITEYDGMETVREVSREWY